MQMIVGLGNPGAGYGKTRHNAGFLALDAYAAGMGGVFSLQKGFQAEVARVAGALLVKPQTYMNLSGGAVQAVMHFYRIPADAVLVVSDDKDLPFGEVRYRAGGGHGGHNGLRDIVGRLGTTDIARVKIGVANALLTRQDTADFVLSRFSEEEMGLLPEVMDRVVQKIEEWRTMKRGG